MNKVAAVFAAVALLTGFGGTAQAQSSDPACESLKTIVKQWEDLTKQLQQSAQQMDPQNSSYAITQSQIAQAQSEAKRYSDLAAQKGCS